MKFLGKFCYFDAILAIFDRYFNKSYESSISWVKTFASGTKNAIYTRKSSYL